MASTALGAPTAVAPVDLGVLAAWADEVAETFVALACDVAMLIDKAGLIVKLVQDELRPVVPSNWRGRAWAATASDDSRVKVEQMLIEVNAIGHARRREINHPDALGGPATIAYSAVRLGTAGSTLAIGHDLRAQVALQQRFVAAQEALERSYWNAHLSLRSRRDAAAMATAAEMQRLAKGPRGLPLPHDLADSELVRALGRLCDRIDTDALPGLLRDARQVAERHFLARALQRAGSVDALARELGVPRRSVLRRGGLSMRRRKR